MKTTPSGSEQEQARKPTATAISVQRAGADSSATASPRAS